MLSVSADVTESTLALELLTINMKKKDLIQYEESEINGGVWCILNWMNNVSSYIWAFKHLVCCYDVRLLIRLEEFTWCFSKKVVWTACACVYLNIECVCV